MPPEAAQATLKAGNHSPWHPHVSKRKNCWDCLCPQDADFGLCCGGMQPASHLCPDCMQGTLTEHKNELLHSRFGINYNTLPAQFRKVCCSPACPPPRKASDHLWALFAKFTASMALRINITFSCVGSQPDSGVAIVLNVDLSPHKHLYTHAGICGVQRDAEGCSQAVCGWQHRFQRTHGACGGARRHHWQEVLARSPNTVVLSRTRFAYKQAQTCTCLQ